ncbi:E1 [Morelia spilota papillomavirus 1]|uniref:Replication protein E1 n=1 Tax=Morelia spilota papillomavirus 1 TaxID=1081054 RepID=G3DRD2_9PAPI|nr:E1 [Morelia spilota papillomavirus 1]AEO16185.1 E1 [Morelia spilota papillomavirus 1]
MADKGIDDFIILEADCEDTDNEPEKDTESLSGTDEDVVVLDSQIEQGNSLALFVEQSNEEDQEQVHWLKRKYISPKTKINPVDSLSPQLSAIQLDIPGAREKTAKRRLFGSVVEDSGIDLSNSLQNEIKNSASKESEGQQVDITLIDDLIKSNNKRAFLLGIFKQNFDISFGELSRPFKSAKTCYGEWVVAVYGVQQVLYESLQTTLASHCSYMHLSYSSKEKHSITLALLTFKTMKCRDTVIKLFKTLLNVQEMQILAEPPKVRSVAAALFWFKTSLFKSAQCTGPLPEWIARQTNFNQLVEETKFDLSTMIQYAYDHDMVEESTIAYNYARLADTDGNAAAWLASSNQAKYVRDCCTMVRHYKRAEMRNMTISAWIHKRCKSVGDADWKQIARFLKLQNVEFMPFVQILKQFLRGIPKKNCLLFYGQPNTGKSMFTMSLIQFLHGKILSFLNSKSQFWLQPLADCKIALIDDATENCWSYIDVYLRNALDGNPICIDCKHKAPLQIKCPPLLITSNIDISTNSKWFYLHSRIHGFKFDVPIPDIDGKPQFTLTDEHWKCFFARLWTHLELSDQEEDSDNGDSQETFRCGARSAS